MKRIMALMLALLTLLSLVACSSDGEEDGGSSIDMSVSNNDLVYRPDENPNEDAFYYEYINGNEIAITGYAGSHKLHAITIPDAIDERKVTAIHASAFKSATNVNAITMPNTVTEIGDMAFYGCTELTAINMPIQYYGHGLNTKIGFDGYNDVKTKKYPNGQPNMMIARSINAGTSFRRPYPFVQRCGKNAKLPAEAAMATSLQGAIDSIVNS